MKAGWIAAIAVALLVLCCAGAAAEGEYSPGCLMQPPQEVLAHIDGRWPDYALEDYCEVRETPKGDYSFALLHKGRARLLVGYHEEDGVMQYWLKSEGAVPQGEEEAWFDVREAGWYDEWNEDRSGYTGQKVYSDGAFTVTRLDDAGESYEQSVTYAWKDGGFQLVGYSKNVVDGVFIRDGYLEFWDWSWPRKEGTVQGTVQTELRYVSFGALPATLAQARESVTVAPEIPQGGLLEAQEVKFKGGRKYDVYTGPGEEYARSGNGKGSVSTNDWIQVFGQMNGYVMIQYDISADHYRIGWIDAAALPKNAQVPTLTFGNGVVTLTKECVLTDDPLNSGAAICTLPAETVVTNLCNLGEDWVYVQARANGKLYCGFVPADGLALLAAEKNTGVRMPAEIAAHVAAVYPDFAVEAYCEMPDMPDGDYAFVLLLRGSERLLEGYRRQDGTWTVYMASKGAVPQGAEEAGFFVYEKGETYSGWNEEAYVSDGRKFSVMKVDEIGESYEGIVEYHWEDGVFRLKEYTAGTVNSVVIRDGVLEFWSNSIGYWGQAPGTVETDITRVDYESLPTRPEDVAQGQG